MRRAKLFIIAGDLFDTTRVTKRVKDEVIAVIKNARDMDFLYLPGNHEQNTLLDGTVEINEDIWYWYIDGRCCETYEEVEE